MGLRHLATKGLRLGQNRKIRHDAKGTASATVKIHLYIHESKWQWKSNKEYVTGKSLFPDVFLNLIVTDLRGVLKENKVCKAGRRGSEN